MAGEQIRIEVVGAGITTPAIGLEVPSLLIEAGFQPWCALAQVAGASHRSAGLEHHHLSGIRMEEAVQIGSGAAGIKVSREPDREGLVEGLSGHVPPPATAR
jgi:hypothetical protein